MKNLILLFMLFLSLATFAQDGYNMPNEHYQHIKDMTENLTENETRRLSIFLIEELPVEYSYVRTVQTSTSTTHIFSLVEKELERFGASLITIQFRKEAERYNFQSLKVHHEGSEAIYVWVRVFLPTATLDLVRHNYKYRDLINANYNLFFRLLDGDEVRSFKRDRQTKFEQ